MLRNTIQTINARVQGNIHRFNPTLLRPTATRALVGRTPLGSTNDFSTSPGLRKWFAQVRNQRTFSSGKQSDSQFLWSKRMLRMLRGWPEWRLTPAVLARLAQLCAASAILLPALDVVYTYVSNKQRKEELASAFRQGSVPQVNHCHLIERPGIAKEIHKVLNPERGYHWYGLIIGYQGTGKTTLVRQVGHEISGVIYVDILPNQTSEDAFSKSLAKAISWSPPRRSWMITLLEKFGISSVDPICDSFFVTIFEEFGEQAELYRKDNDGRIPVLVIDNVNRLAVRNALLLEHLQDIAKDAADNRHFITIFVTSEGKAPLQLLERSAVSRLGSTVTVGDLNFLEVVSLLCDKRGRTKEEAQQIYELVGGRIKLIEDAVNDLEKDVPWPVVRSSILLTAKDLFKKANLQEDSVFRSVGLKIAKVILTKGYIDQDEFCALVGNYDQYVRLLSGNIFACVPRSERITFQSKPVELVAADLVRMNRARWF